jgi:hypothetical protein
MVLLALTSLQVPVWPAFPESYATGVMPLDKWSTRLRAEGPPPSTAVAAGYPYEERSPGLHQPTVPARPNP